MDNEMAILLGHERGYSKVGEREEIRVARKVDASDSEMEFL